MLVTKNFVDSVNGILYKLSDLILFVTHTKIDEDVTSKDLSFAQPLCAIAMTAEK